jgi:ribosomal subunit interface protein
MFKINLQTKGVIITAKQKSQMERKISKLKKYLNGEPVTIDAILTDETSPEKGGVDQSVRLNVTFGKEKIFIEEVDERLMRAFAYAYNRLERNLRRYHQRKTERNKETGGLRLEKVWGIIKRK